MIALLAQLTVQQAVRVSGKMYMPDSYFNPIEVLENWYISAEEVRDCVNPEFAWVNELQIVEVEIPTENEIQ
jgi:hypothetical protein